MKKLGLSIAALAIATGSVIAQPIDIRKKPDPLPVKEFSFPAYTQKVLKNGLKVYIIEDHEQPTVNMELQITGGNLADGNKPGVGQLVADLLTKGTNTRSAFDIAQKLDGVAASVSASSTVGYFSVKGDALKKHLPLMLDVFADVTLNPSFPQDEFDKAIPQIIAGIKGEKSNSNSVAAAMSRKIAYGYNHVYARERTEESLKALSISDLKQYHSTYFKPGSAILAIVGDVKPSEILPMIEKAFSKWKGGKSPAIDVPQAAPMAQGVYFIERPGAVQSTIMTVNPTVPAKHPDFEALRMNASMLGGSFGGRLFKTLRETHSYTYTPGAFMSSAKHMNRFSCIADVRNSVTDSALDVTLRELKRLSSEFVPDEELTNMKRFIVGQYLLSYESAETIASQLLYADYTETSIDEVKKTPQRLMALTLSQLQNAAKKYLLPEQTSLVIVGSKEVLPKLQRFGKVYEYDLDLQSAEAAKSKISAVSMTADEILAQHKKALGGDKLASVTSIVAKGTANISMGGGTSMQSMQGSFTEKKKAPNKRYSLLDLGRMKQEMWMDGTKGWVANPGQGPQEMPADKFAEESADAALFKTAMLKELGYTLKVIGKKDGNIIVEAKAKNAPNPEKIFFDEKTMLVNKIEVIQEVPGMGQITATVKNADYQMVDGIMMPKSIETESPGFTIKLTLQYTLNEAINETEFAPKK
ncbi:MAG TPA: insulinase family protein [Candidatus Kapabacteria bacterium]|nr:insulinase family protein [Candidatus Kapabacteria bacterium]